MTSNDEARILAEQMVPILQAYLAGEKVQTNINGYWQDVKPYHKWNFNSYYYRVRPKSIFPEV